MVEGGASAVGFVCGGEAGGTAVCAFTIRYQELKQFMSNSYQVLSERIYSDFPIFGSCIRQRAAVALSKDKSPNALKILAEAVVRSGDR